MDSVSDRVRRVLISELAVHPDLVDTAAQLDELGADSQDRLSLTLALENEFNLEIPDHEAAGLFTVGDVIWYLEQRVSTIGAA